MGIHWPKHRIQQIEQIEFIGQSTALNEVTEQIVVTEGILECGLIASSTNFSLVCPIMVDIGLFVQSLPPSQSTMLGPFSHLTKVHFDIFWALVFVFDIFTISVLCSCFYVLLPFSITVVFLSLSVPGIEVDSLHVMQGGHIILVHTPCIISY